MRLEIRNTKLPLKGARINLERSCRTALYLRLSRDDDGAGESASITSQRGILTDYAAKNGFSVVAEYVDDGCSGTNFDRPEFRRMLCDIEAQKIDLVLTKDLSRLGRDYILTGHYAEVYFPSRGVRYIAVNDGYDSGGPDSDIAPFRNVLNEMYARDTSRKIRSAFLAKMQNGEYIGNFAPYGYDKDPCDKHHLLPNEAEALVVRKLFSRAADGETPGMLAADCNDRGIAPPALRRRAGAPASQSAACGGWTAASVAHLLRDVVYLGKLAQGKTSKLSFKSKASRRKPFDQWIVVEGTHEPLVDAAQFAQVQAQLRSRSRLKDGSFCNLFSGLAVCADCGRRMSSVGTRRKGSPANLACGGYKLSGSAACTNHFIDYRALYELVLTAVRRECEALSDRDRKSLSFAPPTQGKPASVEQLRAALCARREQLGQTIERLCDDSLKSRVGDDRFCRLLEKYTAQDAALQQELSALPKSVQPLCPSSASAASDAEITELTPRLLFDLIDRIEIGQGRYETTAQGRIKRQEVQIRFRFAASGSVWEFQR